VLKPFVLSKQPDPAIKETVETFVPSAYVNSWLKRAFDVLLVVITLPLTLPLFLLLMVLNYLADGGPVFFKQQRYGRSGRLFTLYKFRTLKKSFASKPGQQHSPDDIHPLGKFLRLSHLDELPQLWNILNGEMSWVGPRPEVPFYVSLYEQKDSNYAKRALVRPGIGGLAQLDNPLASPDQNLEKLIFDLAYIQKASLWMDISILAKTFFVVFR
jgi:lipopolysaccharide/colanic/teichoic acid biosynthesis glycosyltransferase